MSIENEIVGVVVAVLVLVWTTNGCLCRREKDGRHGPSARDANPSIVDITLGAPLSIKCTTKWIVWMVWRFGVVMKMIVDVIVVVMVVLLSHATSGLVLQAFDLV